MSFQAMAWASKQTTGSASRKAVLYALANHANSDGFCRLRIDTICQEAELGQTAVKNALGQLADDGFLDRRRVRVEGHLGCYDYQLRLETPAETLEPESVPSLEPSGVSQEPGRPSEPEDLPPHSPPGPMGQIIARAEARHIDMTISVWETHAPPLIAHRPSYFGEEATRRAIARALKRYGVEDVSKAITNYAIVLDGNEFRWDYRWTIIDFLKRGLDRFVPEARPLENFRIRASTEKFGRRDVSAAEMLATAARLEQDERKEIERATE